MKKLLYLLTIFSVVKMMPMLGTHIVQLPCGWVCKLEQLCISYVVGQGSVAKTSTAATLKR